MYILVDPCDVSPILVRRSNYDTYLLYYSCLLCAPSVRSLRFFNEKRLYISTCARPRPVPCIYKLVEPRRYTTPPTRDIKALTYRSDKNVFVSHVARFEGDTRYIARNHDFTPGSGVPPGVRGQTTTSTINETPPSILVRTRDDPCARKLSLIAPSSRLFSPIRPKPPIRFIRYCNTHPLCA